MFSSPTHSEEESRALYESLNQKTAKLLSHGKSVVFDTNFNFRSDRDKLRQIADQYRAATIIVWVVIDVDVARQRAVHAEYIRNGYSATMNEDRFNDIVAKLEAPSEDEKVIKIDGTKLDEADVLALLST